MSRGLVIKGVERQIKSTVISSRRHSKINVKICKQLAISNYKTSIKAHAFFEFVHRSLLYFGVIL
jgi:hypothetical protein